MQRCMGYCSSVSYEHGRSIWFGAGIGWCGLFGSYAALLYVIVSRIFTPSASAML